MDFLTYGGLKGAVAEFLNRDDLTAQIPGFIQLSEARIRRAVRRKTVRNDAFSISAEVTPVPTDCQEIRSLSPLTGLPRRDRPLKNATPSMLADMRAITSGVGGVPQLFAVVDGNIVVSPPPSQAFPHRIIYFQKLVPLTTDAPVNDILLEAPDIYLYGALCESAPYLEHDERLAVWNSRFQAAVDELNDAREREETAANLHAARLPVWY